MRWLILLLINLFWNFNLIAQDTINNGPNMRCDNPTTVDKAKELVVKYKSEGYEIYRGGFFFLNHNEMLPFFIDMTPSCSYGIIVVGQPDLNYLEVGLGHEAFGKDEIKDKIKKRRDKEFSTFFTYVPPFNGRFLLSIVERVRGEKSFCTAIYVMRKFRGTQNNTN
jgi:hypothetical protein